MILAKEPIPSRTVWPLAIAATLLAVGVRLLPYWVRPANFAAIGALSLYAGARTPIWAAFALPLGAMYISDIVLWYTHDFTPFSWPVYVCYALSVAVGLSLRRTESVWKIGLAAIAMDVFFFVATNAAAWFGMRGGLYEDSFNGLITALIAGLPFHRNTFFGDALFVPLFFGAHALALRLIAVRQKVEA